jgi:hypothetical protein
LQRQRYFNDTHVPLWRGIPAESSPQTLTLSEPEVRPAWYYKGYQEAPSREDEFLRRLNKVYAER